MANPMPKQANILVVEDDIVDVEMLKRGFKKSGIDNTVFYAESGVTALKMLRGEDGAEKISTPVLMLIDINMPMMTGLEMLRELRGDKALQQNIAFILTTSARPQDKAESYQLNVAGYFLKENIDQLISALGPYCQSNQFPDHV